MQYYYFMYVMFLYFIKVENSFEREKETPIELTQKSSRISCIIYAITTKNQCTKTQYTYLNITQIVCRSKLLSFTISSQILSFSYPLNFPVTIFVYHSYYIYTLKLSLYMYVLHRIITQEYEQTHYLTCDQWWI